MRTHVRIEIIERGGELSIVWTRVQHEVLFVPIKTGPRYSANGFIEKAGRSTKGTLANLIVSFPPLRARDTFGADARLPPCFWGYHRCPWGHPKRGGDDGGTPGHLGPSERCHLKAVHRKTLKMKM